MMRNSESEIREEIAYFKAKLSKDLPALTAQQRDLRECYLHFVSRRKQPPAAFLAGWKPGRTTRAEGRSRL